MEKMMETAEEYIEKTESAVKILLAGICTYYNVLKVHHPIFVSSSHDERKIKDEFSTWNNENCSANLAVSKAEEEYFAERFALATLCGSLLQISFKAIEMYSENSSVNKDVVKVVNGEKKGEVRKKVKKFCIGRRISGVPIGLIIYAGRNQHMHLDELELTDQVNINVFGRLAEIEGDKDARHPAFDLQNKLLVSYSANIVALLGWETYDAYLKDMLSLVEVKRSKAR